MRKNGYVMIYYILSGISVLSEGSTGTSKTRTTLIAWEYITKILNKDSEDDDSFFKAYIKGHKILLDKINLAPREVLECILQALDSKVLSVECSVKILKKYKMHPNFGIITTQNPNKEVFANKGQE